MRKIAGPTAVLAEIWKMIWLPLMLRTGTLTSFTVAVTPAGVRPGGRFATVTNAWLPACTDATPVAAFTIGVATNIVRGLPGPVWNPPEILIICRPSKTLNRELVTAALGET